MLRGETDEFCKQVRVKKLNYVVGCTDLHANVAFSCQGQIFAVLFEVEPTRIHFGIKLCQNLTDGCKQACPQDVKSQDRDETETFHFFQILKTEMRR